MGAGNNSILYEKGTSGYPTQKLKEAPSMRTRIISILVSVMLVMSLASTAMAAETTAMVNNPNPDDRLNLRTTPDADAPTLGKYYNGVHVELLGSEKNGWIKVRFGNLVGYMLAEFLETDYSNFVNSVLPSYTINNTAGTGLNLRESQSTKSKSLGFYSNGETGWVYGVGETWCHVQAPDGKVGFMLRKQLSPVLEYQKNSNSNGSASKTNKNGATVNNPNSIDRLNLRTKPSKDAPMLGKYYSGTVVEVLGSEKNGWIKVRFYNLEGYMMTKFLAFGQDQLKVGSAIPSVKIKNRSGTSLNLRKSQSTSSSSLGLYPNGQTVLVYGVNETWCHVQTEDGKVGFMLRKSLSPVLEFDKGSGPNSKTLDTHEGTWFGEPGDPITDDFMPGGNG
jgi:uncharacterized protein YgiM (DUF1202 family)